MINTGADRGQRSRSRDRQAPGFSETLNDRMPPEAEALASDPNLLSASMQGPVADLGERPDHDQYKIEQRTLLEKRNAIQKKIESMRREYDFIQNLDPRDVNYVMEKKKEHAALLVQRNWRRIKAEREYRRNKGKIAREPEVPKTEEDIKQIQQNIDDLAALRDFQKEHNPDRFYDKIGEDRLQELDEQVINARKLKSDKDIQKLEATEIYDKFLPASIRFNGDFQQNEIVRATGHDQLVWSNIMTKYMIDLDAEETERANERIPAELPQN